MKLETYNTEDLLPMRTLRIYASTFYVMVAGSTIKFPCVGMFILGGIIEGSILHSYVCQASQETRTYKLVLLKKTQISGQWSASLTKRVIAS
jgi:hypothetical protein